MPHQYTKTYTLPSESRYTNSMLKRNISQTNSDLKGLIASHNELDAALPSNTGLKPTGIIDAGTDLITLTGVDKDSFLNGMVIGTEVIAAAANPLATVIILVTKDLTGLTSNKIAISVTPNNGDNNTDTPVGLTTAQLALAINGGISATYDGIACTITDAEGWLGHITASSDGTTTLAHSGEGDSDYCVMNGGRINTI